MTEKKCDYCESMSNPLDLTDESTGIQAKICFGENRVDVLSRRLAVELLFHWYNSIKPGSKSYEDLLLICRGAMQTHSAHHTEICFTNDLVGQVHKALGELWNHVLCWPDTLLYNKPNIGQGELEEELKNFLDKKEN